MDAVSQFFGWLFGTRPGVIALVAGGIVLFLIISVCLEVKTRKTERYGRPALAVGLEKQRRIIRAAVWYTSKRQGELPPCRFDVVEVYAPAGGAWSLRHLEGAFEAHGM